MALALLSENQTPRIINGTDCFEVLLDGPRAARITVARNEDIPCPRIDLLLGDYFRPTGRLVESGFGKLPEVEFSVIHRGRKRRFLGVATTLRDGPNVRFPLGLFHPKTPATK
jgi:hypothetical protein